MSFHYFQDAEIGSSSQIERDTTGISDKVLSDTPLELRNKDEERLLLSLSLDLNVDAPIHYPNTYPDEYADVLDQMAISTNKGIQSIYSLIKDLGQLEIRAETLRNNRAMTIIDPETQKPVIVFDKDFLETATPKDMALIMMNEVTHVQAKNLYDIVKTPLTQVVAEELASTVLESIALAAIYHNKEVGDVTRNDIKNTPFDESIKEKLRINPDIETRITANFGKQELSNLEVMTAMIHSLYIYGRVMGYSNSIKPEDVSHNPSEIISAVLPDLDQNILRSADSIYSTFNENPFHSNVLVDDVSRRLDYSNIQGGTYSKAIKLHAPDLSKSRLPQYIIDHVVGNSKEILYQGDNFKVPSFENHNERITFAKTIASDISKEIQDSGYFNDQIIDDQTLENIAFMAIRNLIRDTGTEGDCSIRIELYTDSEYPELKFPLLIGERAGKQPIITYLNPDYLKQ